VSDKRRRDFIAAAVFDEVASFGLRRTGQRLRPPGQFIDHGLVHFPPPTFKHDNRHPYPRITSPIYKYSRDITFVGK
jgi:hypothetical protein